MLTNEILMLSEIASSIALDDFSLLEKTIKSYHIRKYDSLKLYECILQSYLFCGFPAAIESLKIFRKYYENFNVNKSKYTLSEFRTKGEYNCKLIYKKNYKKLIENMNGFSADLKEWMIIEGYGKVLGRKGLSLLERELMNVSILCSRFYANQFYSHSKGVIHLGGSKTELIRLVNNLKHIIGKKNVSSAKLIIAEF